MAGYGKRDKPAQAVPAISLDTLADIVGITKSRVNAFLMKFKKLGFIDYDGADPSENQPLSRERRPAQLKGKFMKPMAILGAGLLVFGIVALIYQGVQYTSHDTVIDIGPIHATADRQRTFPLPPIVGLAAVASGVVLLITGGKARA